jgi:hypothetical protein
MRSEKGPEIEEAREFMAGSRHVNALQPVTNW